VKNLSASLLILFLCVLSKGWSFVQDPNPCLRNLQQNFFREAVVTEALSFYNIPQGLWVPINNDLKVASARVPEQMKRMTSRMVPNPLEYPFQREVVAKLLKQALFEAFLSAMTNNNMVERPTVDMIFDYIFYRQAPFLISCLGEDAVKDLIPKIE
jgi:hypothetical protein